MRGFEAETWVIDRGAEVIEKKHRLGSRALTAVESLIQYLWQVDYCMRNAGDIENLADMSPDCLPEAAKIAEALDLPNTHALFARKRDDFEQQFFEDFDGVVTELLQADS